MQSFNMPRRLIVTSRSGFLVRVFGCNKRQLARWHCFNVSTRDQYCKPPDFIVHCISYDLTESMDTMCKTFRWNSWIFRDGKLVSETWKCLLNNIVLFMTYGYQCQYLLSQATLKTRSWFGDVSHLSLHNGSYSHMERLMTVGSVGSWYNQHIRLTDRRRYRHEMNSWSTVAPWKHPTKAAGRFKIIHGLWSRGTWAPWSFINPFDLKGQERLSDWPKFNAWWCLFCQCLAHAAWTLIQKFLPVGTGSDPEWYQKFGDKLPHCEQWIH